MNTGLLLDTSVGGDDLVDDGQNLTLMQHPHARDVAVIARHLEADFFVGLYLGKDAFLLHQLQLQVQR
ncbi:hypothetical protein D3C73_1512590 [compost metagenome]